MNDLKLNLYKDITDPEIRIACLESEARMWHRIAEHKNEMMEDYIRMWRNAAGIPDQPKKESGSDALVACYLKKEPKP